MLTLTKVSHFLGWVCVIAIIILSWLPSGTRPRTHLFAITQWEHFAAYFVAAALLAQGRTSRKDHFLIPILLGALAAMLEVGQIWVPGRDAKLSDWIAGAAGGWAGVAVWPMLQAAHSFARMLSSAIANRAGR